MMFDLRRQIFAFVGRGAHVAATATGVHNYSSASNYLVSRREAGIQSNAINIAHNLSLDSRE